MWVSDRTGCRRSIPPDQVVEDGDRISMDRNRHFEVIHTPGHEPAHICLRDSRTGALFSGDHILPRITPFVGYDEIFEDALGDFLESLARIEQLKVGAHLPRPWCPGRPWLGTGRAIAGHHQRRLRDMLEVIDPSGSTAWEVMEKVFRPNLGPVEQRLGPARDDRPPRAPAIGGKADVAGSQRCPSVPYAGPMERPIPDCGLAEWGQQIRGTWYWSGEACDLRLEA